MAATSAKLSWTHADRAHQLTIHRVNSLSSYPTDPADLFAVLFDELGDDLFTKRTDAEDWLDDDSVREIASLVAQEIEATGALSDESIERYLDVDDHERNAFAVLQGIDQAFDSVETSAGTYDTEGLESLADRYFTTGRFDSGEAGAGGAVLPRKATGQDHLIPETLREAFASIIRVPESAWAQGDYVVLDSPGAELSRGQREDGLRVGCVPMLVSLEDVICGVARHGGADCYRLAPRDGIKDRVTDALQELDASGAMIGVAPEASLDDEVLDAWRRAIRDFPAPPGSRLRWVLVGTGPVGGGEPPFNRAVVLSRIDATELWTQEKQYRFQLSPRTIKRWGLDDALPISAHEEWIRRGKSLTVVETLAGRFAILVCEDLSELLRLGVTVSEFGVSHALVPIFSEPIRRYRWEHDDAVALLSAGGTRTVVANSRAVADPEPDSDDEPGTAMAVDAEAILGQSVSATDVVGFRFTEEGVVRLTDSANTG